MIKRILLHIYYVTIHVSFNLIIINIVNFFIYYKSRYTRSGRDSSGFVNTALVDTANDVAIKPDPVLS